MGTILGRLNGDTEDARTRSEHIDITSEKRKRKNIFASPSEPGVVNATASTSTVEQSLLVRSLPIKEPCQNPKETIGIPSNGASSRDLLQAQRQAQGK
ncbi:hypothetical protein SeLEV6574_g03027 [Synchytrium endobioticum]|uniref:Uncharacterized protein n=1 Tax=Synchytrium endobioticum TaxID=286115 RepID=A0A507D5U8_9FUNG|nr:hypothetical protein SeLEV6574_g03027 [Synchytrium endobioticum]